MKENTILGLCVIICVLLSAVIAPEPPPSNEHGQAKQGEDTQIGSGKEQSRTSAENTDADVPEVNLLPTSAKNDSGTKVNSPSKAPTPDTADLNCTGDSANCSEVGKPSTKLLAMMSQNKGMLTRTAYVLIGVTLIVVVYYVIRAVR